MNDYKGLVVELRSEAENMRECNHDPWTADDYDKAADAIEQLVKERDAAVKCIEDMETYLQWGASQYAYKVIEEWRGVTE